VAVGESRTGILLNPQCLASGEQEVVAARVRDVLRARG